MASRNSTNLPSLPVTTEFDLSRFLFQQDEVGKRATKEKEKKKTEQANEEKRLTKPEMVLQFLTNPVSQVYTLFLKRAIPIFDTSNQLLQREEPCIQILLPTLEQQLHKILISFCKPEHVITMMSKIKRGIKPALYSKRENQLPDNELSIGQETQTYIQSQSCLELKPFYRDVRKFFSSAADYMILKFPFGDELLRHAAVADIEKRLSAKVHSLHFFIGRFPCILPEDITADQVEDEFRVYQTTTFEDSLLQKRCDEAWKDIGRIKKGGVEVFKNLSAVMLGILVIFHSNADCERIFSLVGKNKTEFRASLATSTISSLVTRKVSFQLEKSYWET